MSYREKLRQMIHSLEMQPLTSLDESQKRYLSKRIKALPSPEKIHSMSEKNAKGAIKKVQMIQYEIDQMAMPRSQTKAVQYMIDTNLPPAKEPITASWWDKSFKKG